MPCCSSGLRGATRTRQAGSQSGRRAAHLVAGAGLWPRRHKDGLVVVLGVDDLHIHHAGAQAQELQVVPHHCRVRGGRRGGVRWAGCGSAGACWEHAVLSGAAAGGALGLPATHDLTSLRPDITAAPSQSLEGTGCCTVAGKLSLLVLQACSRTCEEVLVIVAIAIAVEVGRVLPRLAI